MYKNNRKKENSLSDPLIFSKASIELNEKYNLVTKADNE